MQRLADAIQRLVDIALGADALELFIQLAATVVLVIIVKVFFWEKVTGFIEARRELMDQELTEAMEKNEEAKALKEEAETSFERVKDEARQLLEEAKTRGEDTRRDIIAKAKDEATNIKKDAQKDLAQEVDVARSQLREEIVNIAVMLTEKVIAKKIDQATYERLLEDTINTVRKT